MIRKHRKGYLERGISHILCGEDKDMLIFIKALTEVFQEALFLFSGGFLGHLGQGNLLISLRLNHFFLLKKKEQKLTTNKRTKKTNKRTANRRTTVWQRTNEETNAKKKKKKKKEGKGGSNVRFGKLKGSTQKKKPNLKKKKKNPPKNVQIFLGPFAEQKRQMVLNGIF